MRKGCGHPHCDCGIITRGSCFSVHNGCVRWTMSRICPIRLGRLGLVDLDWRGVDGFTGPVRTARAGTFGGGQYMGSLYWFGMRVDGCSSSIAAGVSQCNGPLVRLTQTRLRYVGPGHDRLGSWTVHTRMRSVGGGRVFTYQTVRFAGRIQRESGATIPPR